MARVKITEFAAKKLLLGESYKGVSCTPGDIVVNCAHLSPGQYVVKVDAGIKKRALKNLVKIGVPSSEIKNVAIDFFIQGYNRILIEPLVQYEPSTEQYASLTLTRTGFMCLFSSVGGTAVEENSELQQFNLPLTSTEDVFPPQLNISSGVQQLILDLKQKMCEFHFTFLEINPFVCINETFVLLDAAALIDTNNLRNMPTWLSEHTINQNHTHPAEQAIKKLNDNSRASFSLTVLSNDAPIFTLLSGGGASLVTLDSLVDAGLSSQIGNYGEYSGAPTKEETAAYTAEVLKLLFSSNAQQKVLLIAGGVANFTDIYTTFTGIADGCNSYLQYFATQKPLVVVRRGGPRQAEGLSFLKDFFRSHEIAHIVLGPDAPLSQVATEVKKYLVCH